MELDGLGCTDICSISRHLKAFSKNSLYLRALQGVKTYAICQSYANRCKNEKIINALGRGNMRVIRPAVSFHGRVFYTLIVGVVVTS